MSTSRIHVLDGIDGHMFSCDCSFIFFHIESTDSEHNFLWRTGIHSPHTKHQNSLSGMSCTWRSWKITGSHTFSNNTHGWGGLQTLLPGNPSLWRHANRAEQDNLKRKAHCAVSLSWWHVHWPGALVSRRSGCWSCGSHRDMWSQNEIYQTVVYCRIINPVTRGGSLSLAPPIRLYHRQGFARELSKAFKTVEIPTGHVSP